MTVPPNPHLVFVFVLLQIYWAGHVHFYNRFEGPIWKGAIIANGTHNPAGTLHSCSGNGGPVLGPHGCLKNGGCWHLADGWEAHVDAEALRLAPLIANKTVAGLFVGDEMVCNGLPFVDFTKLVSRIRSKVGADVLMW